MVNDCSSGQPCESSKSKVGLCLTVPRLPVATSNDFKILYFSDRMVTAVYKRGISTSANRRKAL